jgi:protein phosphatase
MLAFRDGKAWLGHIGDSRAYLLRKGELRQLSEDQTLIAQLLSEGAITPEEADSSPAQNVILQALGVRTNIEPFIGSEGIALEAGDVLVLCSDGVFNMIEEPMIADVAGRLPPQEACDALIEAALAAGGHDNASLGVFSVTAETDARQPLEPTTRRINLPIEQRR